MGTIDQLISLTNKIYQGLDNEEEIAMIFLDLSKAYDRVWHAGLLYKLEKNWNKRYFISLVPVIPNGKNSMSGLCWSCF